MTASDPAQLLRKAARAYEIMSRIRSAALEAWKDIEDEHGDGPKAVKDVLAAHNAHLCEVFPEVAGVSNLSRHIHFNMKGDYWDIINIDLPAIEARINKLLNEPVEGRSFGFEGLLHATIKDKALPLYAGGHYRQSVFEAYTAVFARLRQRSRLDLDGAELVNRALSPGNSVLVLKELATESGKSYQKGMMEMLKGAYQAFRNPLAHPHPDIAVSAQTAARHLVVASVLADRIEKAREPA